MQFLVVCQQSPWKYLMEGECGEQRRRTPAGLQDPVSAKHGDALWVSCNISHLYSLLLPWLLLLTNDNVDDNSPFENALHVYQALVLLLLLLTFNQRGHKK